MDDRIFLLAIACELALILGYGAYTSRQFVRLQAEMLKGILELGKRIELLRRDSWERALAKRARGKEGS